VTDSTQTRLKRALAGTLLVAALLFAASAALIGAQAGRTVQDAVYSDAQAARGYPLYTQRCATCHGADLRGAQGPPLIGEPFIANRQGEPLSGLLAKIRNTMPLDAPGSLTPPQTLDIVAAILKSNGFPAGRADLADATTGSIGWPKASNARPAAAAQTARAYPPVGNVAQLMRGVFFPNSNMIFTVQTHDPGAPVPKPSADAQANGFSWVDWGAGIYGGWQLVDNAAVALADISPLMLAPGLKCENGRPAPITDPEWIKFTEDMIEVAKKTYRISQTRNQEAVSDATGDLSDACAACHRAYRDVVRPGGRGGLDPNDPSNKAGRCQSRAR
jgi:mono/diheme cytochrome c family protein